jgi:TM2 domain-containing membrane protein YozV
MKDKKTALLLCFFLGVFGAHRFYVGQTGKGIIYIFTIGFFGLLPFLDFWIWLLGSQESFDKKYNTQAIQRQQSNIQKDMLNELKISNSKG